MRVIAWGWLFLLISIGVAIAAYGEEVPQPVQKAFDDTNARIVYRNYAAWDARYVEPGTWDFGNCTVFAHTYWRELREKGVEAHIRYIKLPDGRAHVYVQTADGWVLDNMRGEVARANQ